MEISGARVLITGASRGIGASMARAFAGEGAKVALAARSEGEIGALAEELGGSAHVIDVADSSQLDGFVAEVEATGGPIDVLVNNAGIETQALVEDLSEADLERVIAVNLIAPQRLTNQVLAGMIERGRGHLVFTSSAAAMTPSPGLAPYCASKAGLTRFSETLRIELRGTGVGVTTMHLGPVDTSMWDRVTENPAFDASQKRIRRLGLLATVSPEKVAEDAVEAVRKGRREVRHPKRLWMNMALAAAPGRMTELALAGITPRRHR